MSSPPTVSTSSLPLCCLSVWCAGSVQSDYITLMIISPPYHHAISPWQHGNACNPAADAAMLQRGFNKCVVTARFKLRWFAAQRAAQYITLQCALQSTSPQQTWFNQTESHQNMGCCLFLVIDVKNLDALLTRNTHLRSSWAYRILMCHCVALFAYHVFKCNVCFSEWDSDILTHFLKTVTLLALELKPNYPVILDLVIDVWCYYFNYICRMLCLRKFSLFQQTDPNSSFLNLMTAAYVCVCVIHTPMNSLAACKVQRVRTTIVLDRDHTKMT